MAEEKLELIKDYLNAFDQRIEDMAWSGRTPDLQMFKDLVDRIKGVVEA